MKDWTSVNGAAAPHLLQNADIDNAAVSSSLTYILKESSSPNGFLATVMDTVTSLLRKKEATDISRSQPQLLCNSNGGYGWPYLMHKDAPAYRCFMCLGAEKSYTEKAVVLPDQTDDTVAPDAMDHVFIASTDADSLKTFGETTVLTMTALYGEGHRKFRMELGDILVLGGGTPFVADIPTLETMTTSRVLTWTVSKCTSDERAWKMTHTPPPTPMLTIEDILCTIPEAKEFYDSEMSELEKHPKDLKDIGEASIYMERLRVTPGIYDFKGRKDAIANTETFHDVSHWLIK